MTSLCFAVFDCKINENKLYLDECGIYKLNNFNDIINSEYTVEYVYNIFTKTISFCMNLNNDCICVEDIIEYKQQFKNFLNDNFFEIINPQIYLLSGLLKNKLLNSEFENFQLNNTINLLQKIKL